ncbi:hypothetical protein J2810_002580 [Chryseobacterium rhizosphaerae]|uniref:hypothetical protein n=1 Tax=Chryseobacterium rhizosphaerae TaxID=395937 RepID=UPI002854A607|nr:hypothetical protein [Chryseobacterium rhizosphaerae]MDR6546521.1 hypothetical protein [Chryseobacterium rhizosphaerae]
MIDTKNKDNTLSTGEMMRLEDHFEFLYDKNNRNIKWDDWTAPRGERYIYLWIRPLEVYDIEGAKLRDAQNSPSTSNKDKDLPEVNIGGTKFLWDTSNTVLKQKDNPYNRIYRCSMDMRCNVWGLYFDTQKKLSLFPHEIPSYAPTEKLPSHILFIPETEINKKILKAENDLTKKFSKRKGNRL